MKEFNIKNHSVNLYYEDNEISNIPVIVINTFQKEGNLIWKEWNNKKDFILVEIITNKWNEELSPWKVDFSFKNNEKFLGKGKEYLETIEKNILPEIENYITKTLKKNISYYGIVGYSLAGLFALYTAYQSSIFKRIGSVSGSLWYPNILEYVNQNTIKENIEKIYFSLGKEEKNTKNELLRTVEDNTKIIYEIISKRKNTIYEENEGNHFFEERERITKAIFWLLED